MMFTVLAAVNAVQVFDLDTKAKIASIQVDFRVLFWTWLDGSVLAIVSDTGVHRWDCSDPDSQPQPWFDKSPALRDTQIISVASDHSRHWCVVAGISLKVRVTAPNFSSHEMLGWTRCRNTAAV